MPQLSNESRAARAGRAIDHYSDDVAESNLIDLLADAMHWCHAHGENFGRCLRQARRHYHAETREGVAS